MELAKLTWLFSRKRILIAFLIDTIILFLLIFFKINLYGTIYTLNIFNLIYFFLIWTILSYVLGIYIFKLNLFLLDSIKICIKNTSKLFLSISLIYLSNSIFLKLNFLSSNDTLYSINFISLYTIITCINHILIIIYLHNKDSNLRKWILFADKSYRGLFERNFYNLIYKFQIKFIDNLVDLKSIDFQHDNYEGLIISSEKFEQNLDFSFFQKNKISFVTIKDWCQIYIQRYPPEVITSSDILKVNKVLNERNFEMHLKRVADVIISSFLLILLTPILIICSILIFLEDRGPILYSQIRTGLNLKTFRIYKLRSMKVNSEKSGATWAKNNDIRVSRIGKILRRTRIDELPQLWSVLKGEMSLIGPRPERPEFDELLSEKIPFYEGRYLIKPGLSGWAQVNYPYGASEEDSYFKLSYDLFYIENFSFFLDFLIFCKTIRLVINAKGSEQGSKVV